jgi:hypothetical protein
MVKRQEKLYKDGEIEVDCYFSISLTLNKV